MKNLFRYKIPVQVSSVTRLVWQEKQLSLTRNCLAQKRKFHEQLNYSIKYLFFKIDRSVETPTVWDKIDPGHPGTFLRRQEQHHISDILCITSSTQGIARYHIVNKWVVLTAIKTHRNTKISPNHSGTDITNKSLVL